jgi:excisionase family DNA binding protein
VRQVARMLYVSPPTIYSMIGRGELRAWYVRWMVRLRRHDVETYMRLHRDWVLKQRLKHMRRMAKRSD